jgi:hypothetical protein
MFSMVFYGWSMHPTLGTYPLAWKTQPFSYERAWSHGPICPTVWRLGVFSSINGSKVCTIMWLHVSVGFKHEFGACSGFKHTEVRFGEPEPASLKEENGRRPIFLIFWPIEVS